MSDPTDVEDLVATPNAILQKNQKKFTIQVCLHKNLRLVVTIKILVSLPSLLTICSSISAITNPMTNIKKQKLKKLDPM